LADRRFVIIQGPPGTGKTRMATRLLTSVYKGHGKSVQFHANTTYESFVGGLAPASGDGNLGLRFVPQPGVLMRAVSEASADKGRSYLLHIDEINRADLSKVLGEALYLFESDSPDRRIQLALDFGVPWGDSLCLPPNLHVVGTMNSSDRSIALVD